MQKNLIRNKWFSFTGLLQSARPAGRATAELNQSALDQIHNSNSRSLFLLVLVAAPQAVLPFLSISAATTLPHPK